MLYEQQLTVEDAAYICIGDSCVTPGFVDCDPQLVLWCAAVMEAHECFEELRAGVCSGMQVLIVKGWMGRRGVPVSMVEGALL